MKTKGTCIYCSKPAETADHVPPRNLFPKDRRNGLQSVPACKECNEGFSKDDEYFRLFITGHSEHSKSARLILGGEVQRSVKYKPAMAREFIQNLHIEDVRTKSGVYTGKKMSVTTLTPEMKRRHFNVIARIARALLFLRYRELVPKEYEIKTLLLSDAKIKELLPSMLIEQPGSTGDIFHYIHSKEPNSVASIWLMCFYDKITYATFIAPKGTLIDQPVDNQKSQILDLRS